MIDKWQYSAVWQLDNHMRFREFLETAVRLNPYMYDMTTEKGRKEYEDDLAHAQELMQRRQDRGHIVSRKLQSEPVTITCWRGGPESDFQRDIVQQGNGWIDLGGENAMEGILWFTHSLQTPSEMGFNPREYALSHAEDYLITYPLKAIKHYDVVTYSSGETEKDLPDEYMDRVERAALSSFAAMHNCVYEVPKPWKFTWQLQKHLGTTQVRVFDSMIERVR